MPNRLADEVSPYLLQHAHNPVDWYPWGAAAFAKARAEDKPVFLSIGYAACHWCHVMERESFEDKATADFLNEHFVAIKVDREERPDIDSIYMQAVQMMTGHGGWPMSMFLTPAGKPFFAGTYFPPEDRYGAPAFTRVLQHVTNAFRTRRDEVEAAAEEVRDAIRPPRVERTSSITREHLDRSAERIAMNFDPVHGGFGSAPKFPPSMTLEFLMQVAWRRDDAALRAIVTQTLAKMAHGGMYDQIGGGFHRYSVDERWLVPHFEKMLYDNALLARLYVRAWQWTHDPEFARVAKEILGFVRREMTAPNGGFYATLDADSEGEEGKFYVWSKEEVVNALGDRDGTIFCALYDVSKGGNWEGSNILNMPRSPADVAGDFSVTLEVIADIAARGKCTLYGIRSQRVWPARDEKILSGWNGWMLTAFAEAHLAWGGYEEAIRRNAEFLLSRIDASGHLIRHAAIGGLLEDYAGAATGLLSAYEAIHDRSFLDAAAKLAEQIAGRFADPDGGFFDTPTDHEELITRPKDLFDNATPGGTSLAIDLFSRLGLILGRGDFEDIAVAALESVFPLAERYPSGFGYLLCAAEWHTGSPREIVLTGDAIEPLERAIGSVYVPHRAIVAGRASSDLPLMEGRDREKTMAYVCERGVCGEPTSDSERLRELLSVHPS